MADKHSKVSCGAPRDSIAGYRPGCIRLAVGPAWHAAVLYNHSAIFALEMSTDFSHASIEGPNVRHLCTPTLPNQHGHVGSMRALEMRPGQV